MHWRDCVRLLTAILVVVFFPVRALSADRFIVKPKVAGEWRVDSNYYKEESDESEVYTYVLRPGIEAGYMTAKSLVALDYTLDLFYFDHKDEVPPGEEESDDFLGHTLSFNGRTRPLKRITVGVDESFYQTTDPYQSDTLSNSENRDEYWINRFSPFVLYEFHPRFSTGARYRRTDVRYKSDVEEDSLEHRGIFDLIYHFSPGASLDLQYQHWKMMYDTTSDYKSDQVKLILRKQFNHFSFEVGGGYHERCFEDSSLDDIDTFTYHGGAQWNRARSHVSFFMERNFDDYHESGDYLKGHRFTGEVGHIFQERLPAAIRGIYQRSSYENVTRDDINKGREDDTYRIAGSLGYIATPWLTFTGEAGYEERDSNLTGSDYENEYVMFRVDLAYDMGSQGR